MNISYKNIEQSIQHHSCLTYIDVPWVVDEYISNITKPLEKKSFNIPNLNNKVLIGSGEQGFLQLLLDGKLKKGRYHTVTPCFRDESVYDDTHSLHFMKHEIFITKMISKRELMICINECMEFFKNVIVLSHNYELSLEKTDLGYDINLVCPNRAIELGSYGIGKYENYSWIYATAAAEPRLSYCQKIAECGEAW